MKSQNTNLLPLSVTIPNTIIYTAKAIQFISHKLATKFSIKLFTTPVRFPIPKREKQFYKSAQKSTLTIPNISKEIAILSYGYSKKKVLLVHGWSGRATQFYMLADKLLEKGYMVIAFDGPAHGNSTGKTSVMPEFLDTITTIKEKHGPFEAAIGHSFGGLCLYNATATSLKIKKLVTIGAADTISEVIYNFTQNLKLKPSIAKRMKKLFDLEWQRNIDQHSASTMAQKISIPTLVVHDSKDADVLVSNAYNIRQNLQKGKLLITQRLGHTKILRNEKVTSDIVNFITNSNV